MVEELFQKVLDPHFPVPSRFIHSEAHQPPKLELFEEVQLLDRNNSTCTESSTVQIPDKPTAHTEL